MLAEDFPETCRVIHEARETLDGPLKGVACLNTRATTSPNSKTSRCRTWATSGRL